jgi:hypothetical protein
MPVSPNKAVPTKTKITWEQVRAASEKAKNVSVRGCGIVHPVALWGNDGTILTYSPTIAMGFVQMDWDCINQQPGKCAATRTR